MYNNYYAPYQRPIGYYNPSMPNGQEMQNYTAQQYQPVMPQNSSGMIWVLNESEATSYPVAPNNSVTLWDKNVDTVYIKSANMQGVPSMRILDYKERIQDNGTKTAQNEFNVMSGKFVCIDDFNAMQAKFDGLQNELNELKSKGKAKPVKREVADDEQ